MFDLLKWILSKSKSERETEVIKNESRPPEPEEEITHTGTNAGVLNNSVVVMMDRRSSRSSTIGQSFSQRLKYHMLSLFGVIILIIVLFCIVSR